MYPLRNKIIQVLSLLLSKMTLYVFVVKIERCMRKIEAY